MTPDEPHQQSLFSGPEIERDLSRDLGMAEKKVDAVYVTRFQKERWAEKDQAYPRIDRKFLNEPKYSDASVMHPLPRVGELDVAFDSDRRAVYFEQAAYGVPIRMALISLLLGIKGKIAASFRGRVRARRDTRSTTSRAARHPLRQSELHRARADGGAVRAQQVLHRAGRRRSGAAALRLLRARHRALRGRQQEEQMVRGRSFCRCSARPTMDSRTSSCSPTKPRRRRPASIPDAHAGRTPARDVPARRSKM